jgi:4-hydroxybenzoate polyprenyltransferase
MITAACAWAFNSGLTSAAYLAATAVLLVGPDRAPSVPAGVALIAFYWLMYLVDRIKAAPEDLVSGGTSAASFVRARMPVFRSLAVGTGVALLVCCVWQPWLVLAVVLSLVVSLAYLVPIPGLGKRVKELPGCKPLYLGLTVATITGAFAWLDGAALAPAGVALASANVLVNTALYDLKDLAADRRAGLRSLAALLGPRLFTALHVLNTATVVLAWIATPPATAWIATALAGLYAFVLGWTRRHRFDIRAAAGIDTASAVVLVAGWLALG